MCPVNTLLNSCTWHPGGGAREWGLGRALSGPEAGARGAPARPRARGGGAPPCAGAPTRGDGRARREVSILAAEPLEREELALAVQGRAVAVEGLAVVAEAPLARRRRGIRRCLQLTAAGWL